ncbi:MAG: hypothetical protein ABW360_05610 [Phenylobacterium sp.]
MPWPSLPEPYRLKAELLARVTAGETIAAVCATPGFPKPATVCFWARRDPEFRADLARAKTIGAHRRRYDFDEATAQALLARIRTGEGIVSILRDPAMPSRRVYARWRATEGHFQEEVGRLNAMKRQENGHRLRRRYRAFDQVLADRIHVAVAKGAPLEATLRADPELPGRPALTRWRAQNREFDRALRTAILVGQRVRGRARVRCTPALTETITDRLREGATLAELGRTPGLPSAGTLRGWLRRRRDFADACRDAWDAREEAVADQVLDVAEAVTPDTLADSQARIEALKRESARLRKRSAHATR